MSHPVGGPHAAVRARRRQSARHHDARRRRHQQPRQATGQGAPGGKLRSRAWTRLQRLVQQALAGSLQKAEGSDADTPPPQTRPRAATAPAAARVATAAREANQRHRRAPALKLLPRAW